MKKSHKITKSESVKQDTYKVGGFWN